MVSPVNSTKQSGINRISIHQNLLKKIEAMEILPLTAKPEKKKKDNYKNGKLQINKHINVTAKILNKLLPSQIQRI